MNPGRVIKHVLASHTGKLEAKVKGWELIHKSVVLCTCAKGNEDGSCFQTDPVILNRSFCHI